MRLSRQLALGIGVAVIFGSVMVGSVRGNIFEVAGKTVNLLGCPLFGLFFLAIFIKFSTPFGAIVGAIYSTTSAVLIGSLGRPDRPAADHIPLDRPHFICGQPLGRGCLFSLLPTRGRPPAVLALFSAATLVPLFAFVGCLIAWAR